MTLPGAQPVDLQTMVRLLDQRMRVLEMRLQAAEQRLQPKSTWRDQERERAEQVMQEIENAIVEGCELDHPTDVGSSVPELMQVLNRAGVPVFRTEHSQKIMLAKVLRRMGFQPKMGSDGRYYAGIRPKRQEEGQ